MRANKVKLSIFLNQYTNKRSSSYHDAQLSGEMAGYSRNYVAMLLKRKKVMEMIAEREKVLPCDEVGTIDWALKESLSNYQKSDKGADQYRWFVVWLKLKGYGGGIKSDVDEGESNTTGFQKQIRNIVGEGGNAEVKKPELNAAQLATLATLPTHEIVKEK